LRRTNRRGLHASPGAAPLRIEKIPKAEFQHGRTRNLCAQMARGEFVAFLTQDALPADEFWLYHIVTVLERFPDAAGAFGRRMPWADSTPFTKRDINATSANRSRSRARIKVGKTALYNALQR
jgi:hypothetical protein